MVCHEMPSVVILNAKMNDMEKYCSKGQFPMLLIIYSINYDLPFPYFMNALPNLWNHTFVTSKAQKRAFLFIIQRFYSFVDKVGAKKSYRSEQWILLMNYHYSLCLLRSNSRLGWDELLQYQSHADKMKHWRPVGRCTGAVRPQMCGSVADL